MENLFRVQDAQELNDPEKVALTWVKHLYGLVDKLNDTETQLIGMKQKDAIKLKEVNLVEHYPKKTRDCLRMDCIITCYNLVKNTTTSAREQQVEYGLRRLTD